MKNVLLSFVIFAVFFGILKLGILNVFDNTYFPIFAFVLLVIIFICAIIFVGVPKIDDISKILKKEDKDNDKK